MATYSQESKLSAAIRKGAASRPAQVAVVGGVVAGIIVAQGVVTYALASLGETVVEGVVGVFAG